LVSWEICVGDLKNHKKNPPQKTPGSDKKKKGRVSSGRNLKCSGQGGEIPLDRRKKNTSGCRKNQNHKESPGEWPWNKKKNAVTSGGESGGTLKPEDGGTQKGKGTPRGGKSQIRKVLPRSASLTKDKIANHKLTLSKESKSGLTHCGKHPGH